MTDAVPSHAGHQPGATPALSGPATPLRRLLALLRPDKGDLIAVAAFAVAVGVLLLATPISVQALVNFVAMGGALQPLIVVAGLLLLGLTLAAVLSALQTWTVELVQRRIFVRMVADVAARLPRVRFSIYDTRYGPEVVNRFFDIITIQKSSAFLLLDGLSILLSVLVALVVLAFYHPLLFAFDVVLLAIIATIVLGPLRRGTTTAIAESKAKYAVVGWFEEVARNPHVFKSGGSEQWVHREADRLANDYLDKRAAHFKVLFRQVVAALGLQVVSSVALLGIGGLLVINGALTLGQLVAAEVIVTLAVSSVAKLGKHLESWYDLMAATDKVWQLLELEVEDEGTVDGRDADEAGARGAAVQVQSLAWAHPTGAVLFSGLDLDVAAGECVAVSGPVGAGKSVLLQVLWRARRPTHGAVRVDGVDLRDYSPTALRRIAALVGANPDVVVGTLRENVTLGREGVTDADVRDALDRVGLRERVSLLPEGLDTPLRPIGQPLSGGETRRLLLARALADRPRIILVQDLLDHMEADERRRLLDVMREDGRTVIVVSNAPDIHERCDRVLDLGPPSADPTASFVEAAS